VIGYSIENAIWGNFLAHNSQEYTTSTIFDTWPLSEALQFDYIKACYPEGLIEWYKSEFHVW